VRLTGTLENDYRYHVAATAPSTAPTDSMPDSPFLPLFRRYLREQGLPVTHQREAVADVVFQSAEHLSVEEIDEQLRTRGERIGKATVYRTLEILVRSGLVQEHDFGEGFKRYEHLFGQRSTHDHLICTNCGTVVEFESKDLLALQERAARAHDFEPLRHRLEIYGLCGSCREQGVAIDYEGLTCPVIQSA
jgi:Fur family transcriptional regulator, ferric uptake regulator